MLLKNLPLLPTQIVGSYCKPQWLLNRSKRYHLDGMEWVPPADRLQEAKRDAALLAIYEQERAGLDIITDGEAQRSMYDRHFATQIEGIEISELGSERSRAHLPRRHALNDSDGQLEYRETHAPTISGELGLRHPIGLYELKLLRAVSQKPVKATVIGPYTALHKLNNKFYASDAEAARSIARVINQELHALQEAGADILQLDEPSCNSGLAVADSVLLECLEIAADGISVPLVVHVCYGYAYNVVNKAPTEQYAKLIQLLSQSAVISAISIEYEQPRHQPELLKHFGSKGVILGLLDLGTNEIETPEHIASRIRSALSTVGPERLSLSSDCGMWHLERDVAYGKIKALAEGAALVRNELV